MNISCKTFRYTKIKVKEIAITIYFYYNIVLLVLKIILLHSYVVSSMQTNRKKFARHYIMSYELHILYFNRFSI